MNLCTSPEPPRSYACEGVDSFRKTGFARHLTSAATKFMVPMRAKFGVGAFPEPPGFGLRQPSGAFDPPGRSKSGRGLPHSKTLTHGFLLPRSMIPMRDFEFAEASPKRL